KNGPHTQWLNTPYMFLLGRISTGEGCSLSGGVGTDTPTPNYKGGIDIFVIANDTAICGLNARAMKTLLQQLRTVEATNLPKKNLQKHWQEEGTNNIRRPYRCKVAQKIRSMTHSHLTSPRPTIKITPQEGSVMKQHLMEIFPGKTPLCTPPNTIIWTDGSCIKPTTTDGPNKLGAAAYNGYNGETLYIDPAGTGCTNTIQRAELAAIRAAIARYKHNAKNLTIATDSQSLP
ncbi:hypothetical protein Vafri_5440, partial [Volvox africanus]